MASAKDKHVVILGAGYGGAVLAKKLDHSMQVTVVEKKEQFFHNVGSLRATVNPSWLNRIFIPYDHLLQRGQMIHDTVVEASDHEVRLASGKRLSFDYLVLATGSSYPFPAKTSHNDVDSSAQNFENMSIRIKQAQNILLIGAGPVGIELAGEIAYAYPDKNITLVHSEPVLLGRFKPQLGERLLRELQRAGVRVVLGERVQDLPTPIDTVPDQAPIVLEHYHTDKGTAIDADLVFLCFGARPITDYLLPELARSRDTSGYIMVNQYLQVEGYPYIFALGDVANTAEPKLAAIAGFHAAVVAENIQRLAAATQHPPTLKAYRPLTADVLLVPIGPKKGAGQLPLLNGLIIGSFLTSQIKGKSLLTERYRKAFGSTR